MPGEAAVAGRKVAIVDYTRTPFSKFGGILRDVSSIELAAHVMKRLAERCGLEPGTIDEVYYGTAILAESALEVNIPSRQAALKAGLPPAQVVVTVERACCSSMTALRLAYRAIKSGEADTCLVVGTENMSRVPFLLDPGVRWGKSLGHLTLMDNMFLMQPPGFNPVAVDAGQIALEYGIGREEQDRWALRSQQLYAEALAQGKIQAEIVPLEVKPTKGETVVFDHDEFPKPDTTLEGLARLPTIYGSPTVTAGNAPGLDAGAAGLVLMEGERAKAQGFNPLAEIVAAVAHAMESRYIATVPAHTITKALNQLDLTIGGISLVEINEAFAAVPLVSTKILGGGDPQETREIRARTNVNGGAIAIGHPVGASGARIAGTLVCELQRRSGGYGVAAICGGLGQGEAVVMKV